MSKDNIDKKINLLDLFSSQESRNKRNQADYDSDAYPNAVMDMGWSWETNLQLAMKELERCVRDARKAGDYKAVSAIIKQKAELMGLYEAHSARWREMEHSAICYRDASTPRQASEPAMNEYGWDHPAPARKIASDTLGRSLYSVLEKKGLAEELPLDQSDLSASSSGVKPAKEPS